MKTSLRAATYRAKTMEDKMKSLQRRADGSAATTPSPGTTRPSSGGLQRDGSGRCAYSLDAYTRAGSHTPGGGSAADGSAAGGSAAGGSAAGGSAAGGSAGAGSGAGGAASPDANLADLSASHHQTVPSPDGALMPPPPPRTSPKGPLERSPEPSEEARASVRAQAVAQAVSANSAMWEAEEQEAERDVQRTLDGILAPLLAPAAAEVAAEVAEAKRKELPAASAADFVKAAEYAETELELEATSAPPHAGHAAAEGESRAGASAVTDEEGVRGLAQLKCDGIGGGTAAATRPPGAGGSESARVAKAAKHRGVVPDRAQSARAGGTTGSRGGGVRPGLDVDAEDTEEVLSDAFTVTHCGGSNPGRAASAATSRAASSHPRVYSKQPGSPGRNANNVRRANVSECVSTTPNASPRASAGGAALRQPCAALPYQLRPVTPVHGGGGGGSGGSAATKPSAQGMLGGSSSGRSSRSSRGSLHGGSPRSAAFAKPVASGPPTSLVEKMRQRQEALASLVGTRSQIAMEALSRADDAVVRPHEAALATASVRRAEAERRSVFEDAMHEGPMDVWKAAGKEPEAGGTLRGNSAASPRGGAPERRVRTFVGLNFVR